MLVLEPSDIEVCLLNSLIKVRKGCL